MTTVIQWLVAKASRLVCAVGDLRVLLGLSLHWNYLVSSDSGTSLCWPIPRGFRLARQCFHHDSNFVRAPCLAAWVTPFIWFGRGSYQLLLVEAGPRDVPFAGWDYVLLAALPSVFRSWHELMSS